MLSDEEGSEVVITFTDVNEFVVLVRNGFERALGEVEAQNKTDLDQLSQQYLRQLEQVQRYFNESGNAAAALVTRDEISRVRSGDELVAFSEEDQFDKLMQSRDRYSEAKGKIDEAYFAEISRLVDIGRDALEKRASELTRQGDLDRVEALTKLIPDWTGRPELVEKTIKSRHALESEDEDFLVGKRINYPHETKPDSTVSMVFNGDGKATYIGLGGLERPWSYKSAGEVDEYHFWMTGRPETPDWVYTLVIHPDGRTGTVTKGANYKVEARIRN